MVVAHIDAGESVRWYVGFGWNPLGNETRIVCLEQAVDSVDEAL